MAFMTKCDFYLESFICQFVYYIIVTLEREELASMKKILIVGKNSYIGNSFQEWMQQHTECEIDKLSSRNNEWKKKDFGKYDAILHVAGIAHVDARADMEQQYYAVNRDLTIACCKKAKEEGAGQFIFLSSIIVYGESTSLEPILITPNTKPEPNGFYGRSKLEAEEGILPMEEEGFRVSIIRPPMVYGKGSKGNYPKLAKLAEISPVFPNIKNERSMIHIDNLCECIRFVIEEKKGGIFCPQNREYVSTTELVKEIACQKGKKIRLIRFFNPILRFMAKKINLINKVFGSFVYAKECSNCFEWSYCVSDFKETIEKTER